LWEGLGKKIIIWPEYFLASLTRREGRRVSKVLAIDKLVPEELLKACERLGYECIIEEGKKYPPLGIRSLNYRIIIEVPEKTSLSKNQIIKELAEAVKRNTV